MMHISPPTTPIYHAPKHGFRTFLFLWLTQSISVIGSALTYFSITVWLAEDLYPLPEQKGQLALALSATGIAWSLTHILVTPFAGAWADRHDRKITMIVCDFLNGLLSLVLVGFFLAGSLHLWVLLVIMALSTVVGDFHMSSFDTSYAMLVPESQLPRANGLMQTSSSISSILSPALAATLIALPALARQGVIPGELGALLAPIRSGIAVAIGLDALTFFLAALTPLLLFIPSPKRTDQGTPKSLWADIREGGMYIYQRRPMLWLLLTYMVANLLFAFMSMLRPMVVKFGLAPDWGAQGYTFETAFALLSSAIGIGGVLGGFLISTWGGMKKNRVIGMLVALLVAAVMQLLFGLAGSLIFSAAVSAVWSGLIPFMNAHSQSIWQSQTPRELQGRVFAVRRVFGQFTYPIGTAIAGGLGSIFRPGSVVAVAGGLLVIFCVIMLFNPSLRRVEDKAYLDRLAGGAPPLTGSTD